MITDLDRRYLQDHRLPSWFHLLVNDRNIFFMVPDFPISSKAFRFSFLACQSAGISATPYGMPRCPKSNRDSLEYIVKFHKYINEAIHLSSFHEVCYASYMAVLFEYMTPTTSISRTTNMVVYAKGMLDSFSRLIDQDGLGSPSHYNFQEFHKLSYATLSGIFNQYFSSSSALGPTEAEIEKVHGFIMSLVSLSSRLSKEGIVYIDTVLQGLGRCLNMEFHSFLKLRGSLSHERRSLVKSIKNTIQTITQQITAIILGNSRYYAVRRWIDMFMDEDQKLSFEAAN